MKVLIEHQGVCFQTSNIGFWLVVGNGISSHNMWHKKIHLKNSKSFLQNSGIQPQEGRWYISLIWSRGYDMA